MSNVEKQDITDLPEILNAFEQALELERELGTRAVDCDRALLLPVSRADRERQEVQERQEGRDHQDHPASAGAADERDAEACSMQDPSCP